MALRNFHFAGLSLVAVLLLAPNACADSAAAGESVVIDFTTTGSVIVDFTFAHGADAQHFCSTTSPGWDHAAESGSDYEVRYDAGPRRAASHFRLVAPAYRPGMPSSNDAANSWIDFWADGDEWLGNGKDDPKFKVSIDFAPDGRGGTFKASHLRAARDGKISAGDEAVDVKGEWHCPLDAATPVKISD